MDNPNISVRIRRHETLPCPSLSPTKSGIRHHRTIHPTGFKPRRSTAPPKTTTASFLIDRRLGGTKNNPYVGSFRHAPPTSLRSMAASAFPSISSRTRAASVSSSSASNVYAPSFTFMPTSPYVGWFRHAPPAFSSLFYPGRSSSSATTVTKNGSKTRHTKKTESSRMVQHKINSSSLSELDRWHRQLTSLLLLGVDDEATDKAPLPLLLRRIVNGRLLGGSGKGDSTTTTSSGSIIQTCNRLHQRNATSSNHPLLSSSQLMQPRYNTVVSRLTSWLLFPLVYADDECFDDYRSLKSKASAASSGGGLKSILSSRGLSSIETDSEDTDDEDEHDDESDSCASDSSSSLDYDPTDGRNSVPAGVSHELEREFSEEANVSVSEIAEAYYAHQLLERRLRSNSDTSQQSGLSPSSYPGTDGEEDHHQRLDYEITQMDIARMARNASRHLDVDSILNLPTIVYRKPKAPPPPSSLRLPPGEQSYHHVCTPIREDRSDATATASPQDSLVNVAADTTTTSHADTMVSEDGWSFMMVNEAKSSVQDSFVDTHYTPDRDPTSEAPASLPASTDDVCVICLEAFRDGDRLRVLPCDHSFHVGCIDRWLSGSHSHNECFTAGCPTCKKRPSVPPETCVPVASSSGSLPSWAFANLGSAMASSAGDF